MKIRHTKAVTEMVEIGDFYAVFSLPTAPRIKLGLSCKCAACGREITDEKFIAGIKRGFPNAMLHADCCPQWQIHQARADTDRAGEKGSG